MKKIFYLLLVALIITINTNAQTHIYDSYFSANLPTYYWDISGSPYLIEENINIHFGSDLIIEPGVEVLFQGHYYMDIKGSINAIGTQDERITFTSDRENPWNGIRFDFSEIPNPTPSKLHFCDISNARKNGTNCQSPDPEGSGGAIYVKTFSDLEIIECDIFNNSVLDHGGAIGVFNNSSPLIKKNLIHDNYAGHKGGGLSMVNGCNPDIKSNSLYDNISKKGGGAIFIGIIGGSSSNPNIIDNVISNNSTIGVNGLFGEGGGIYICNSDPKISSNNFNNNHAFSNGGGVFIEKASNVLLFDNDFLNNTSNKDGGGVCIKHYSNEAHVRINSCQFDENSAVNGGAIYCEESYTDILFSIFNNNTASTDGGGVCVIVSTLNIEYCIFEENTATGNGGGVYMNDPIAYSDNTNPNMPIITLPTNKLNIYKSNTAYEGSGLYVFRNNQATSYYQNDFMVLNNLFVKNHATDKGVVYMQGNNKNTIFNHNTVSDNTADSWISGVCVEDDNYFPLVDATHKYFHNNIIYESIDILIITGTYQNQPPSTYSTLASLNYLYYVYNPNPSPGFVSSTDYHLTSSSPCINAGVNSAPMTAVDLGGYQRISNGITDYGSYEFGSTPPARRSNPNSLILNGDITIYPNPATDFLIINSSSEQNMDISIYSTSGQRVYLSENSLINGEKTIFLSDFKPGVYFIKLQTQNTSINKRIIIQ